MSPMSAEATVVRTYIETLLEVPWNKTTKINVDLNKAKEILDEDHYGLKEVKERILEYLAVQQRVRKLKWNSDCQCFAVSSQSSVAPVYYKKKKTTV